MKLSKRIFTGITLTTLITVAVTSALIITLMYGIMSKEIRGQVRDEAIYLSSVITKDNCDEISYGGANRITLITADGTVIYDSSGSLEAMENHAKRPEFKDAQKYGTGESLRTSNTFGRETYYFAARTNYGSVLRVACETSSMFGVITKSLPGILFMIIILLAVAMTAAGLLTKSITGPINKLNIDRPLAAETYGELTPLLERIDKQNKERDMTEKLRREFSANVSHELKTPLTSIMGCSEIMKEGIVKPEDMPKFLTQINSEAKRLLALIDDIIRLSGLDESAGAIELCETDAGRIAEDVCAELAEKAAASNITLTSEISHERINGNARLLHEMIYNLADNSIRYNRDGGSVNITVGRTDDNLPYVSVRDTGIGIAESEQERIFERFYRVDKSHSRSTGGTGLGLSIVKHAALIMGGKIEIKSALGEGTEIKVIF